MMSYEGGGGRSGKRLPGRQAAFLNPRWRLSRDPSSLLDPPSRNRSAGAAETRWRKGNSCERRGGGSVKLKICFSPSVSSFLFFLPLSRLLPTPAPPAFSFTWQWHLFTCRPCNYLTSLPHQLSGVFKAAIIMRRALLRHIFALACSLSFYVSLLRFHLFELLPALLPESLTTLGTKKVPESFHCVFSLLHPSLSTRTGSRDTCTCRDAPRRRNDIQPRIIDGEHV